MDIVKKVFPILGVIITIILTVTFRTIPKGKTWENYNILYVKTDTMPANTQNILRDCGIMEYVSIENQRVPIMLSRNSIEETMLKLNLSSAENIREALKSSLPGVRPADSVKNSCCKSESVITSILSFLRGMEKKFIKSDLLMP